MIFDGSVDLEFDLILTFDQFNCWSPYIYLIQFAKLEKDISAVSRSELSSDQQITESFFIYVLKEQMKIHQSLSVTSCFILFMYIDIYFWNHFKLAILFYKDIYNLESFILLLKSINWKYLDIYPCLTNA